MRYFCVFLPALLLAITGARAQGWELQPSAGAGFTGMLSPAYPDMTVIASYNAGIGLTRNFKKFRLGIGITYLTTGYRIGGNFTVVDSSGQPVGTTTGEFTLRYTHLGLPLTAGYNLTIVRRLHIVPVAGIMPAYNPVARKRFTSGYSSYGPVALSKDGYDSSYNRFSLFATAQARLVFDAGNRLSVFAGPAFSIMLTSIGKKQAGYRNKEQEFAAGFEAGLGLKFLSPRPAKQPPGN